LVERVEVAVSPVNGPLLVFEVHHDLVNLQNTKRAKMLIQRKKRRERRKKEERRKKRKEELTVNRFDCAFDSTLVSCATMEASASLICPFFPSCNQKKRTNNCKKHSWGGKDHPILELSNQISIQLS